MVGISRICTMADFTLLNFDLDLGFVQIAHASHG